MEAIREENNKLKAIPGRVIKALLIPVVLIILIIIILMGSIYYIFRKDLKEISKASIDYYDSLEITPEGIQSSNNPVNAEETGDIPAELRTFEILGHIYPEYPQKARVGDISLYAGERYGDPAYGKTLGESGCGAFSMASILSGLLNRNIDPVDFRDDMEKYYGDYRYYDFEVGSNGSSYNDSFLSETYGVRSADCNSTNYEAGIQALNDGKCAVGGITGHIIAIVPVPDGYTGDFFVIDSAFGLTGAYRSMEEFEEKCGEDFIFKKLIYIE